MPELQRPCRYCGHMNVWHARACGSCEKPRWNDPDDTRLGRELGEMERQNPDVARAAAAMDALGKKKS
jgi:hypothetical protein